MAKAKLKTLENNGSVKDFLNAVPDETRRKDSFQVMKIMEEVTGLPPKMWGPAIVGFGSYHYKYESGHEGDMPLIAFSPRKDALTLYLEQEFEKKEELLGKLGKHKASKACLYIKKMADVDIKILEKMIAISYKQSKKQR